MHKLIDFICDELDELERKADKDGKLSMAEIQYGDTLAHFKKNLLTAEAMTDEGDYSGDYGRTYRTYRRNNIGRYSRNSYPRAEDDMEGLISELRGMMPDLPAEKQREVQKFIQRMGQM